MIRSLSRAKRVRTRTSAISPKIRGNIIRSVAQTGEYAGSWHKVKFSIYRGDHEVYLMLREGRRWSTRPMSTVWDCLMLVEERARCKQEQSK